MVQDQGIAWRRTLRHGTAIASLALCVAVGPSMLTHAEAPGSEGRSAAERPSEPRLSDQDETQRDNEDGPPSADEADSSPVPDIYRQQMRIAQALLAKGNLPMAANFFQRAHGTRPEAPEPLTNIAAILKKAERHEQLASVQAALLDLQPHNGELVVEYGMTLLRLGRKKDARIQLHTALEDSDAPRIYSALGVTYDMDGDHRSAQAYYRIALENDPEYLAAMGNLGLSLALSGDHRDSVAILTRLVADPASKAEHREILAAVYAMAGDLDAAGAVTGRAFDAAEAERAMNHYGLTPMSKDTGAL